ncbi:MAG: tetratricopeptide repeat protein [Elusimicrobia bacterium]|nr:tetratricopeptide repeat protein [Elusimicrobiota bacterium]
MEGTVERCASCGAPVKLGKTVCDFCGCSVLPGTPGMGLLDADEVRVERAFEQSLKKLRLNPDDPAALCQLGVCYFKREQYEKAIETLQKAADVSPRNGRVQYLRALSVAKGRSWISPEVAALATQALSLDPTLSDAQCLLHIYNGRRLFEEWEALIDGFYGKTPDKILDEYRTALKTPVPELLPVLYFFSGDVYEAFGNPPDAIKMFEAAFRFGYPQAKVLIRLGKLLAASGRVKDAAAALQKACQLDPSNEAVAQLLAQVQAAQ